jgi:hypothetical protein
MLESPGKWNFSNVQYFFGMRYVARNDSLDMDWATHLSFGPCTIVLGF